MFFKLKSLRLKKKNSNAVLFMDEMSRNSIMREMAEYFVPEDMLLAYFEAYWSKPLDIITSFRIIFFEKKQSFCIGKAIFDYFEYLFVNRGCKALNWIVAEKNYHAYRIYEKVIKNYFGHRVGIRHRGQMAYNGEISDIILYEVTQDEYLEWKKNRKKSQKQSLE